MFQVIYQKRVVFWLAIVMICSFAILFVSSLAKPAKEFDREEIAKIDNTKEIVINAPYTDINLVPSDSNDLKVHLYGKEKAIPELRVTSENQRVRIDLKRSHIITFYNGEIKLDIYIPKAYSQDLAAKTPSHSISLTGLNLNKLSCQSSSGDIFIKSVSAAETELETASGNMTISDYNGNLNALNSAGSISAAYSVLNSRVVLETASGAIDLKLPGNAEFQLVAKTSSGTINSEFPINVSGLLEKNTLKGTVKNDRNKINLTTVSGDIHIHK